MTGPASYAQTALAAPRRPLGAAAVSAVLDRRRRLTAHNLLILRHAETFKYAKSAEPWHVCGTRAPPAQFPSVSSTICPQAT
jgi:hypothetical protein